MSRYLSSLRSLPLLVQVLIGFLSVCTILGAFVTVVTNDEYNDYLENN